MLQGKCIVVGVTGGIAAYKSASLVSALRKQHAEVHVIMTENAKEFIAPLVFETLSGNKCLTDTFDRNFAFDVAHISIAKAADLIVVAPATANFLAKAAHGIADDMLTTVVLAATCTKLIAPAMNTNMYRNPVTQENLTALRRYGFGILEPDSGLLACGDEGEGKMPEPEVLMEEILLHTACEKDLAGQRVLVTAGSTQEAIDPVRYLTNHSSGKMGYALARAAAFRGAEVTLVTGKTTLAPPRGVTVRSVTSAEEMHTAVLELAPQCDFVFKAAAVADYTPAVRYDSKIKKSGDDLTLPLTRTRDILADLAAIRRDDQVIVGFAMETENLLENAKDKLQRKRLDLICANSLRTPGAGFAGDSNVVTLISEGATVALGERSKTETAQCILDKALELKRRK